MAIYGPVTVGRVTLTEDYRVSDSAGQGGRALSLTGQEASEVTGSQTAARERAEALLAYDGAVVPVTFDARPNLNGWYMVDAPSADDTTWGTHTDARWKVTLRRIGRDSEVEVESRLTGGDRTHASAATAELWHAPSVGAGGYLVGTGSPGHVDRVGADGTVRVYRAIPADTHPRWSVPVGSALAGAASIAVNGTVRTGVTCDDTPASWVLSNGLLRVEPRTGAGTLRVTSYLASGWGTAKVFDVKRGTTSLGSAQHVTILRNDPCEAVIRLTWDHSPGRTVADLTLCRGARYVGLYVQQYAASSALRVDDDGVVGSVWDQLTAQGFIYGASDDADANRWSIGTTVASAAAGGFGLAASSPALGLSAYVACIRGGDSAALGDGAEDVNAQFLGQPAQAERVVRR